MTKNFRIVEFFTIFVENSKYNKWKSNNINYDHWGAYILI